MKQQTTESIPTTCAGEVVYETAPIKPKYVIEGDGGEGEDDGVEEEEVRDFGLKNFGERAYLYNRRFLDKGIQREDDGRFMIRDSTFLLMIRVTSL